MKTATRQRFGDLYAEPSKNGVTRPSRVRGLGHPMVNMGEMFAHPRLINPEMELVPMSDVELAKFDLRAGDLLFARQSLILEGAGKCSIVKQLPEDTTFESHLIRVRLNTDIANPDFYFYYLNSSITPVKSIVTQGVQAGIRASELSEIQVFVPELGTQNRIAAILAAYDDMIENNRRRIKLLEESARLVYREWFVRLRFPGHELIKIDNGIPEDWQRTPVAQAIDFNPKETLPKGGIRFVPMGALSESGMTVNANLTEIRESGTTVKFRNGDTLLARITPCLENGKTAFVGFLSEDEVASGSTEFIVMRGAKVGPCFTYCLARSEEFRGIAVASMVGSSGRQRAQVSVIGEFSIVLPPSNVVEDFESLVRPTFDQIWTLVRANQRLTKARDLLLPRLMSGQIEV